MKRNGVGVVAAGDARHARNIAHPENAAGTVERQGQSADIVVSAQGGYYRNGDADGVLGEKRIRPDYGLFVTRNKRIVLVGENAPPGTRYGGVHVGEPRDKLHVLFYGLQVTYQQYLVDALRHHRVNL